MVRQYGKRLTITHTFECRGLSSWFVLQIGHHEPAPCIRGTSHATSLLLSNNTSEVPRTTALSLLMISVKAFGLFGGVWIIFHIREVKGLSAMFCRSRGFLSTLGSRNTTPVIADGPRSAIAQLCKPAQEPLVALLLIVELGLFDLFP